MSYTLVDDALVKRLDTERDGWLLLEPHPDFRGHWKVNSFAPDFVFDFYNLIGPYRAVSPAGLEAFLALAEECSYQVAFFEDPTEALGAFEAFNEPPSFQTNSSFEGTIKGMLPFQVQGFNMLKDLPAGVLRWDTGTGKTVGASSVIRYHRSQQDFDICFFVVKKNNKINTVRKLERLAGIESVLVRGTKSQRTRLYDEIEGDNERGTVVVLNYENFLDFVADDELLRPELFGRDLLFIWDEMPVKLKTRTTRLYRAICTCLYDTHAPKVNWDKRRSQNLRQYMLSATPIENDPEDWFNCIRLMTGGAVYGTVKQFRDRYVRTYDYWDPNRPATWHDLDRMWLECAFMVHQVDKTDPDIAKHFPEQIEEPYFIEWEGRDKVYNELAERAQQLHDTPDQIHTFSLISLLQMVCDAPTMVLDSAARRKAFDDAIDAWIDDGGDGRPPNPEGSEAALKLLDGLQERVTNDKHPKLEALRQLLLERHPDEKAVIFATWNDALMPVLETHLAEWGVSYVRYDGTEKQKQEAQDAFQEDPNVRVFLSSDSGSDSIDLDAGSVVIHYDLPWKWTTKIQRQNRIHRPTSSFSTVYIYLLMMENSVEDRRLEIIEEKQGHHDALFGGKAIDLSASARMTKQDLLYILTGNR